jgi:transglutaminase-like putative cysteine protease
MSIQSGCRSRLEGSCRLLVLGLALLLEAHRPSLPADITAGEDAVILDENTSIDIHSPEEARVRYSRRLQILTARGAQEYGGVAVGYNKWVTIEELRASVISAQGKSVDVKKQSIVDSDQFGSYELYSDSKQRTIVFPGAAPGAILEHRYELLVRNLFFLPAEMDLQEEIPIQSRTLTVTAPASFALRVSVHGGAPAYSRTEEGGRVTQRWQVTNVPGFKREPDMPPLEDVVGSVSVTPKEGIWEGSRIDATQWDGVASWDWDLARDRVSPTPEIAQMAREVTAGVTDPTEKIRKLYEFVQDKVAYVAIELGIGGWQPHAAADVLRHRYGDCKDKAALLIAMMRSVGLQGYPVLVRTRNEGLLDRDDPTPFNFNHVIVATPEEDGYLFMDPTWEKATLGDLPYTDQGMPVLVVKDDGRGDLVDTALTPPERNRTHRLVTASIGPTGDLTGTYVIDYRGQARLRMSYELDSKPTEQENFVADLMGWLCPGAVMKAHEITRPAKPDDPLRITIRFEVPRFVTRAGNFEVVSPYLVRFPELTRITAYSARRTPVYFPFLFSTTSETRLHLPAGRTVKKLPADKESSGPGLTASTHHELTRDGDRQVLVVKRSVSVSRREIPVSDYQGLRDFLSGLAQEESRAVTLEAVAASAALSRLDRDRAGPPAIR